jgi:hypothetical protein
MIFSWTRTLGVSIDDAKGTAEVMVKIAYFIFDCAGTHSLRPFALRLEILIFLADLLIRL